jgi:hypothetical protein
MGKRERRYEVLRQRIATTGLPVVYANLAGGQDELVFDGGSFVLDSRGSCAVSCRSSRKRWQWSISSMASHNRVPSLPHGLPGSRGLPGAGARRARLPRQERFSRRHHRPFRRHRLGADAGIAVDALGADKVRAVMMPSPYTAQMSLDDSREMVRLLGVRTTKSPSLPAMEQFAVMLAPFSPAGRPIPPKRTCRRASAACS